MYYSLFLVVIWYLSNFPATMQNVDYYNFTLLWLVIIFNIYKSATRGNVNTILTVKESYNIHTSLSSHDTHFITLSSRNWCTSWLKKHGVLSRFSSFISQSSTRPGSAPDSRSERWQLPPAERLHLGMFMDNLPILKDHFLSDEKIWYLNILFFSFLFLKLHHPIANRELEVEHKAKQLCTGVFPL